MLYLRAFDPEEKYIADMGYSSEYGIGILIDSTVREDGQRYSRVSNYYEPNLAMEQGENTIGHQMCHKLYDGNNYAITKVAVEYEYPIIKVSYWDHES